jgi:hypothetical protein
MSFVRRLLGAPSQSVALCRSVVRGSPVDAAGKDRPAAMAPILKATRGVADAEGAVRAILLSVARLFSRINRAAGRHRT